MSMPVKRRALPSTSGSPVEAFTVVSSFPEPRLIKIPQAAAYLQCSVFAVRELIRHKAIPKIHLGKRFLIDKTDLDAWVEKAKRGSA